jgi:predicted dehydrogenase
VSIADCSFFSQSQPDLFPQTLALVEGTEGSLQLSSDFLLRVCQRDAVTETSVEPQVPAWGARPWHCIQDSVINFQRHVVDVLEGRATPAPSGAHNRETLALALAAYESASQNRVISLSPPRSQS